MIVQFLQDYKGETRAFKAGDVADLARVHSAELIVHGVVKAITRPDDYEKVPEKPAPEPEIVFVPIVVQESELTETEQPKKPRKKKA